MNKHDRVVSDAEKTADAASSVTTSHGYRNIDSPGYGSFEVLEICEPGFCGNLLLGDPDNDTYYDTQDECEENDGYWVEPGFYYQACFPGFLPDSEHLEGPYESEQEATRNIYESMAEDAATSDDKEALNELDALLADLKSTVSQGSPAP